MAPIHCFEVKAFKQGENEYNHDEVVATWGHRVKPNRLKLRFL